MKAEPTRTNFLNDVEFARRMSTRLRVRLKIPCIGWFNGPAFVIVGVALVFLSAALGQTNAPAPKPSLKEIRTLGYDGIEATGNASAGSAKQHQLRTSMLPSGLRIFGKREKQGGMTGSLSLLPMRAMSGKLILKTRAEKAKYFAVTEAKDGALKPQELKLGPTPATWSLKVDGRMFHFTVIDSTGAKVVDVEQREDYIKGIGFAATLPNIADEADFLVTFD